LACYLCAYQLGIDPDARKELPDGAPPWARYALGTCAICSVWACSRHGTRYGQFECAICTPASATKQALSPPSPGGEQGATNTTAAAIAYAVGVQASEEMKQTVRSALGSISEHQRPDVSRVEALGYAAPRSGDPDLLLNFSEVIRARTGEEGDFLPGVSRGRLEAFGPGGAPGPWEEEAAVSIDAVGAAVRDAFAGRPIELTGHAVEIVTGALLLSMAVANRPRTVAQGPGLVGAALEAEVARPWDITHPVLLDPVMWVVATAYEDQR
jgi:hypothetical protein